MGMSAQLNKTIQAKKTARKTGSSTLNYTTKSGKKGTTTITYNKGAYKSASQVEQPTETVKLVKLSTPDGEQATYYGETQEGNIRDVDQEGAKQLESQINSQKAKQEEINTRIKGRFDAISKKAEQEGRILNEKDIRAIYGGVRGVVEAERYTDQIQTQVKSQLDSYIPSIGVSKKFAGKYYAQSKEILKTNQQDFFKLTGIENATPEDMNLVYANLPAFLDIQRRQKISQAKEIMQNNFGMTGKVAVGLMNINSKVKNSETYSNLLTVASKSKEIYFKTNETIINLVENNPLSQKLQPSSTESLINVKTTGVKAEIGEDGILHIKKEPNVNIIEFAFDYIVDKKPKKAVLDMNTNLYDTTEGVTLFDGIYKNQEPMIEYSTQMNKGLLSGYARYITTKPLNYISLSLIGGTVGYGSTYLASLGVGSATAMEGLGILAGGTYATVKGVEIYKKRKNPAILGEELGQTLAQAQAFGTGAIAGGELALSSGLVPQPSSIPKLKYTDFKVNEINTKIPQTTTYYRGVSWERTFLNKDGNLVVKGGQILGYANNKLYFGENYPSLNIVSGDPITFSNPVHRKLLDKMSFGDSKSAQLLPESDAFITSLAGNERQKWNDIWRIVEDRGTSYKIDEKPFTQLFSRNVRSFKDSKNIDLYLNQLGKVKNPLGKTASISYGSATITPQVRPLYQEQIGASGDFDSLIFKSEGAIGKFAQITSTKLNQAGEMTFVDSANPLLIQTRLKDAQHLADLHSYYGVSDPSQIPPQESFFGYPFNQKPFVLEGNLKAMPLSEANLRYASSSFTPHIREGKLYFAPQEHRIKDVQRLMVTTKQLLENQDLTVIDSARLKKWYPSEVFETPAPTIPLKVQSPKVSVPIKLISVSSVPQFSSPSVSPSPSISISSSPSVSPSPSISISSSPSVSPSPSISPSISPNPNPQVVIGGGGFNINSKQSSQGYDTYVKEKGKWSKLNKKTMGKDSAWNFGADAVDNSASASFKIKPSSRKPTETYNTFTNRRPKFREKKGVFIEKNTHRIDSQGELNGISAKGWASNRRKGLFKGVF